jgi:hypothetical protein
MADIVAQLAPSADQRRSSVIGDGKGLDYPLRAAPVAILIGDPYLARSADRVADRRRQVALCRNRRSALRDIDWRCSQVCNAKRGSGYASALSIHQDSSRLETDDERRIVAGHVLLAGSDPTGDAVASISAPAERLSERRACGVA